MPKNDTDIIKRILEGETKAFALLIDRHKAMGMTLALRMLKNRQDAEEALQDAFLRAFKALDRFERKSAFSTWFFRILYNVCSSQLKLRKEPQNISLSNNDDEPPVQLQSDEPLPDIDFETLEFRNIVCEEIEKLDAMYAGVLTLFLLQDLGYDEIVEVTGLPLGTVKTRLSRARLQLRERVLKRYEGRRIQRRKNEILFEEIRL